MLAGMPAKASPTGSPPCHVLLKEEKNARKKGFMGDFLDDPQGTLSSTALSAHVANCTVRPVWLRGDQHPKAKRCILSASFPTAVRV